MARFVVLLAFLILIAGLEAKNRPKRKQSRSMKGTPNNLFRLPFVKDYYLATLEIGNPPKRKMVSFDTDTSLTKLVTYMCNTPGGSNERKCDPQAPGYSPTTSSTSKTNGTPSLYANFTDQVRMPHSSNPKKMISTFSYQADKGYDFYCDELGVCTGSTIGLGLQSLKHPSSFISQAIKAGLFSKPQYTIHYKLPGPGEIVFGGVDTKRCSRAQKPIEVADPNSDAWSFRLASYEIIYRKKGDQPKIIKSNPEEMATKGPKLHLTSAYYNGLPEKVFLELKRIGGITSNAPDFIIPCDAELIFKLKLKDRRGNTTCVEYPLKKEPQDGTGECKLRLVAYAGAEWFDIVAESTIHEQICIHHDLDKKSATFSRRLK